MTNLATITSKRQLTIPVEVFKKAKLAQKQKVLVEVDNGLVKITPAAYFVEQLAGSVKVPAKFKGLSMNQIIAQAKKDYFSKKLARK